MPDLKSDLDHLALSIVPAAATPGELNAQLAHDLQRGQSALRKRRAVTVLVSAAAVAVLGVGVQLVDLPGGRPVVAGGDAAVAAQAPSSLARVDVATGAYRVVTVPRGWEVQGGDTFSVTLAPRSAANSDAADYDGKLVVSLVTEGYGGEEIRVGDTTYDTVDGNYGYDFMSRSTRAEEPRGVLQAQYPSDAGLTVEIVAAVLDGITVLPSAVPGLG